MNESTDAAGRRGAVMHPRSEINALIEGKDLSALLLRAGELHGHYCPGVSSGVLAAVYGLHRLSEFRQVPLRRILGSDGLEELLAVVETNSCFADGVQFITGCTFGNNGLIYLDFGKTAVTLADRSGSGVRVRRRPDGGVLFEKEFPRFVELFEDVITNQNRDPERMRLFKEASAEASFGMLDLDLGALFQTEAVTVEIPPYAPIRESVVCESCGESVMGGKTTIRAGKQLCFPCARSAHLGLTGAGISQIP